MAKERKEARSTKDDSSGDPQTLSITDPLVPSPSTVSPVPHTSISTLHDPERREEMEERTC